MVHNFRGSLIASSSSLVFRRRMRLRFEGTSGRSRSLSSIPCGATDSHRGRLPKRRGVLTIEMLLVLPILLFVLMGVFEFSILFFARANVVQACRTAARQASLRSVDQSQVENIVRRVLTPSLQRNLIVLYEPAVRSGEAVTVAVQVPMKNAAPDLLWPIGFSLEGRYLTQETSFLRE